MKIKNNKLKLLVIVLILFLCSLFINIRNSFGIYKSNLSTPINLTVLDPEANYVVTFDLNDGSGNTSLEYRSYNQPIGTLPTPTRENYNFLGWYDENERRINSDELITSNITFYAHWQKIVCKRAQTGTLHTETCATGGGCLKHGYTLNSTITYGTIPGQNSPIAGDAYDCDVNNDGTYSPTTERFYFVRETTNSDEKAILVHYTSFDELGQMDNSSSRSNYTYDAGKAYLPDSTVWSNPALTTIDGKVSRYISHDDLAAACGDPIVYDNVAYLNTCQFFLETSRYQSSSLGRSGIWVDKINDTLYRIQAAVVEVENPNKLDSANTVRPVIEIPIDALEGYQENEEYTISFNTHGGSSVASITKHAGETLGTLPTTTKEHNTFDGWYATFENDTYSDAVTSSTPVTGDMILHAKWLPKVTHTVTFDADGGTVNGESTFDLIVDDGSTVSANDIPEPVYDGGEFDGWYIDGNLSLPFTSSTIVNDDLTVVANWIIGNHVARVNGVGYETLAAAIEAVPTTGVKTTVTILKDITLTETEVVTIPSGKWVELDIGQNTITGSFSTAGNMITNNGKLDIISGEMIFTNYNSTKATKIIVNNSGATLNISGNCTLTNEGTNAGSNNVDHPVIENNGGTINITGGVLNSNGFAASINNNSGTINMSGGRIIAHSVTKGQAIYMAGGTVNISGNAYLENTSGTGDSRAAVDNNGGTLNITGGTIVSNGWSAVNTRKAGKTTNIGTNGEPVDITSPVLRGYRYGLEQSNGTVNVYDGLFESLTNTTAYAGSITNKTTYEWTNSDVLVDGVTYHATYFNLPSFTVRFFPENGDNTILITVDNGSTIGSQMPNDPTKTDYYFVGWYDGNTLITSSKTVTQNIDAYAKWVQSVSNATFDTAMSITVNETDTIEFEEDDIEDVTYSSSDNTVATVDADGTVHAVGVGTATITITGSLSTDTRTVTVTVTQIMHTVKFYDDDYNPNDLEHSTLIDTVQVASGSSVAAGDIPTATPPSENYVFAGWFIDGDGTAPFTSSVTVTGDLIVVASWNEKVTYAALSTTPSPFELIVGDTGQITIEPTITGDTVEPYTFTSGNTNYATVGESTGVVTGEGIGDTYITVTGTLSGLTVQVPVSVDILKYTVTFKDGNTVIDEVEVPANTAIGNANMPANPTKTNYAFNGWIYEDNNTMTPFTSAVQIGGDIDVFASWSETVTYATLSTTPTPFKLIIGDTGQITLAPTVSGDTVEPYTFTSGNTNYATVGESTGVVTGAGIGDTNITVTGTLSGLTVQVPVSVDILKYTVTFKDGNTVIDEVEVPANSSVGSANMPANPSKTNYIFNGWVYEDNNTLTPFTSAVQIGGDIDVFASWKEEIDIATLPEDPLTIMLGNSKQIVVSPTNVENLVEDYTLSSSNTNILEVNGKIITGASAGTVTLTITGAESNKSEAITVEVLDSYAVTFDPDNGDTPTVIHVEIGSSIDDSGETLPSNPIKTDYVFDNWYIYENGSLTTTRLDTTATINNDITYKAKWVDDTYVAAVYGETTLYKTTLATAISAVSNSSSAEIRILQDIINPSGRTTISGGKDITIDANGHTLSCDDSGSTSGNLLYVAGGTLRLKNGTFTCSKAGLATLETSGNTDSYGYLYIENGAIVTNTGDRGAIYNSGTVYINGGRLESSTGLRSTITNSSATARVEMSGGTVMQTATSYTSDSKNNGKGAIKVDKGTVIITGGTVISHSTDSAAIDHTSSGTLIIGVDDTDNSYDATTPVIQGEQYGINATKAYSIYDGIIKGKSNNQAVNDFTKITGTESGSERETGTDGAYYTLYYNIVNAKYHIDFNANNGTVTPAYKEFDLNSPITASDLPEPTRTNYTFDGWYTDSNFQTPFATFTPTSVDTVTYYAKWTYSSSSFTPVNHNILSNAMQDYFTNVSTWVATDATDPSNEAPNTVPPQTQSAAANYDNGHHLFKASIDEVFTDNGCSPCGQDNACSSPQAGIYCDQPSGYDTGIGEDVNVYLYENNTKGSQVTYTTSTGGVIYNMIPGKTYLWESATDNTKYGVVTATGSRRTLKTSVRNLRDLGGLSASNSDVSGTIDYGRLYRGAQITSQQGVTDLTKLGITREVDLRGDNDGIQTYKMANYDTGTSSSYTNIIITNYIINPVATTYITDPHSTNYRAVKSAMRAIMEKVVFEHDSIFFHCTIGTDRTGTMAYFLEGLLGVSEEDRLRDYEMTYFFGLTNRTRFHDSVSWSGTNPRFYSMYRSYPTNQDIYNYYTYESHTPDPNDPNDLTDDELLRRFRLELIH